MNQVNFPKLKVIFYIYRITYYITFKEVYYEQGGNENGTNKQGESGNGYGDIEVLITKITQRKSKDGAEYISVSLLDINSGDTFNVISKDMELLKLKPMTRYEINLDLTEGKYGLKLEIDKIGQVLGGI